MFKPAKNDAKTTDGAAKGPTGGKDPGKGAEPPADPNAAANPTSTGRGEGENAKAGDTDKSNKGAGGGTREYTCKRPVRYKHKPHPIGSKIKLPAQIAERLLKNGVIAE